MSRVSIQKIYGNIYFNSTGEGYGREGKIREATLFGRKFFLVSSDGVTKRLNRGSLIEFLNAETEKIEGLKGKSLDKGWFFGCFFGSSDSDIKKVYDAVFEKIKDNKLKEADERTKQNKSAILHLLKTLKKEQYLEVYEGIHSNLKADSEFMVEVVNIFPEAIRHVDKKVLTEDFLN